MTRTIKTATDLGGSGTAVTEPGLFHLSIMEAADGASTKGNEMDGCSAILSVLASSAEGQEEKQFNLHLFDPDTNKPPEKQEFPRKKQTAYGIAGNQIDPSKLGESMSVDFGAGMVGQQVLAKLAYGTKKVCDASTEYKEVYVEDKSKIELSYADIFHVDDPRAKSYPKNAEALALIPADRRKPAEYFAPLQKGAPKSAPKAAAPLDLDGI